MKEFFNKYGKWTIIGSAIFLVIGLVCLIVGFGCTEGWANVGKWFGSKYASILYVGLVVYAIVVLSMWKLGRRK